MIHGVGPISFFQVLADVFNKVGSNILGLGVRGSMEGEGRGGLDLLGCDESFLSHAL